MVKYYPFLIRYRGLSRGVGIISNKFLAKDLEEAEEIVKREYIFWPNAYVVRLVMEVPELIEEREEGE